MRTRGVVLLDAGLAGAAAFLALYGDTGRLKSGSTHDTEACHSQLQSTAKREFQHLCGRELSRSKQIRMISSTSIKSTG